MNDRPLFLDCDTGIDDALALAYLLNCDLSLAGISTVIGNTSAKQASINTLGLLSLAGRLNVPLAVGDHEPSDGTFGGGESEVHGQNGVGDVCLPVDGTPPNATR